MDYSAYFIIFITTVTGLYFHWWLYRRIQRWTSRDLALSMAGDDPARRSYMLECLERAQREKVPHKQLGAWLQQQADAYRPQ